MLMYNSYTPLLIRYAPPFGASLRLLLRYAAFRLISPCLAIACYFCIHPLSHRRESAAALRVVEHFAAGACTVQPGTTVIRVIVA